jgi:hypothetical protein
MNPSFARDAFHLTPAGYAALADLVSPALADCLRGPPSAEPER